jgi:hypothetical protein
MASTRRSSRSSSRANGAADPSGTTRASDRDKDSLIEPQEVDALMQQFATLAQKSVGGATAGALGPIAPTLLAVATRYAKREPLKAMVIGAVVAGLYMLGRQWWQSQVSEIEDSGRAPAATAAA